MSATLHFVFGHPGAGKTRLARTLAADLPTVLFVEDEWVATFVESITSFESFLEASRRARRRRMTVSARPRRR